jgi:hypothetical protein
MNPHSVPVAIMAGITLYVGVYNLLFWFRLREKSERFYFFGVCASVALYDVFSALLYNSQRFETSIWFQRGQFCAIALIASWTLLFVTRLFHQKLSAVRWALLTLFVLYIVVSWIDSPLLLDLGAKAPKNFTLGPLAVSYIELQPGPLLLALYALIMMGIVASYAYFWRGFRTYKDRAFPFVQASLTVFFLANVNDILVGSGLIRSVYLLEYSFLAVIVAMDYVIRRDFVILFNKEKEYARNLEREVKERTAELEASLANVKTLSGLIPICASCKKVRDDKGYWRQVEEYVAAHSEADFSHGICPDCLKKLYPEQYEQYRFLQNAGKNAGAAAKK